MHWVCCEVQTSTVLGLESAHSQFLGLNIDNAEEENRVRARPATCVSRIEGSGHTCARGVATPGIDDVGRPKHEGDQ